MTVEEFIRAGNDRKTELLHNSVDDERILYFQYLKSNLKEAFSYITYLQICFVGDDMFEMPNLESVRYILHAQPQRSPWAIHVADLGDQFQLTIEGDYENPFKRYSGEPLNYRSASDLLIHVGQRYRKVAVLISIENYFMLPWRDCKNFRDFCRVNEQYIKGVVPIAPWSWNFCSRFGNTDEMHLKLNRYGIVVLSTYQSCPGTATERIDDSYVEFFVYGSESSIQFVNILREISDVKVTAAQTTKALGELKPIRGVWNGNITSERLSGKGYKPYGGGSRHLVTDWVRLYSMKGFISASPIVVRIQSSCLGCDALRYALLKSAKRFNLLQNLGD